jgi:hypothetical protein
MQFRSNIILCSESENNHINALLEQNTEFLKDKTCNFFALNSYDT